LNIIDGLTKLSYLCGVLSRPLLQLCNGLFHLIFAIYKLHDVLELDWESLLFTLSRLGNHLLFKHYLRLS
jgi:hypothetical protein